MSSEKYVKEAWLRREPTSPQEISDIHGIADRSMSDAAVEPLFDGLRFNTTFNALLAPANTALRASGYRTTNQQGYHTRTLSTLEYTTGANPKLIRKLLAFSKNSNVASYDSAGSISDQELKQILSTAEDIRHTVQTWLRTTHSELVGQS